MSSHVIPHPSSREPALLPPPADVAELADIILAFQRRLLISLSSQLAPGGVSFTQFFLLTGLRQEPSLTMSEIAQKMGNTTAAATGLVDRLETLGYVERAHAVEDRRKVRVSITNGGMDLVARIKDELIHSLNSVMTHLSTEEQKAWLAIYRKVSSVCQCQGK